MRYARIIELCSPPNYPWNTVHLTPALEGGAEQALDVKRGIFRSARHAGISAHHVEIITDEGGAHRVTFQLAPKSVGRAAIAAQVKAGQTLSYNLRRGQG